MGIIMHENVAYGGGSVVEPNPQESATEQLETLGIDGDVYEVTDANAVHSTDVGSANGVAELDSNGKVPASQLPSYVDDVVEAYYDSVSDRFYEESTFTTVIPPESGKTWVDIPTNKSYRWTGSVYVRVDEGVQLGETSDTAYRGDRGKIAYDHSQSDHSGIKPAFTEASTRANIASGETIATIFGKIKKFFSDLKTVAFTGAYSDLSGTPTIPTVNNGTLTIQRNGTQVQTFSANQSGNATANITVPEVEETDTTNSTPYLYRASQNSGDRCYLRQLVGASFGVNQLVQNGNFASTSKWRSYNGNKTSFTVSNNVATITFKQASSSAFYDLGLAQNEFTFVNNHKYYCCYDVKTTLQYVSMDLFGTANGKQRQVKNNQWDKWEGIFTSDLAQNYRQIIIQPFSSVTTSDTMQVKNATLINLTQMFGTAIADKAYTMEQTTAGSGIAWLKSYGFFTESYYPYNTGSLQSVNTSGKVCGGKNLLKKYTSETYNGVSFVTNIDGSVSVKGTATSTINKDVIINEYELPYSDSYTLSGSPSGGGASSYQMWIYDMTISSALSGEDTGSGATIVLDRSHKYSVRIRVASGYTIDKTFYPMLKLASVTDDTYEPHTTHTTDISPIDLRGVPKLVDDNIVYDGDVRDENGTVTRKYEHLNLGSLNYTYSNNRFVSTTAISPIATSAADTVCGIYHEKFTSWNSFVNYTGGNAMYIDYDNHNLYIKNPSYSDAATFKSAMNGVYLDYKKTTTTTEQTTPIQNPQIYNSNGTEQFIDNRTVPIPVGHNSEYVNLPDWLEDGYYKDFRQRVDETLPNEIESASTWKLFAESPNANIALPTNCKELYICVIYVTGSTSAIMYDFHILPDTLTKATSYFRHGDYYTPDYFCRCEIRIRKTSSVYDTRVEHLYMNNTTDRAENTTVKVYYR